MGGLPRASGVGMGGLPGRRASASGLWVPLFGKKSKSFEGKTPKKCQKHNFFVRKAKVSRGKHQKSARNANFS